MSIEDRTASRRVDKHPVPRRTITSLFFVLLLADPSVPAPAAGEQSLRCGTSDDFSRTLFEAHQARLRASRAVQSKNAQASSGRLDIIDGIAILEGDATTTFGGSPFTVSEGISLRLKPNQQRSFDVERLPLVYDTTVTQPVSQLGNSTSVELPLNFTFPLAEKNYRTVWVSRTGCFSFGSAFDVTYAGGGFEYYTLVRAINDRTPRFCPYFKKLAWWDVRILSKPSELTIALQSSAGTLGVQATLRATGEVIFSYKKFGEPGLRAVIATTGQESFWQMLTPIASVDGPANSPLRNTAVLQMTGTNVLMLRFQSRTPLANLTPGSVSFQVDLFADSGFTQRFGSARVQMASSGWQAEVDVRLRFFAGELVQRFGIDPKSLMVAGDTISFLIPMGIFPGTRGPLFAAVNNFPSGSYRLPATIDISSAEDINTDFSIGPMKERSVPLLSLEEWTTVDYFAVAERVKELGNIWDSLVVYTTFVPDLPDVFNCFRGNTEVQGIGPVNTAGPPSPSILMMKRLPNEVDCDGISVLSHEFGHNWLYSFSIMENGKKTGSLRRDDNHPAINVHLPAAFPVCRDRGAGGEIESSVMGGGYWAANADGSFSTAKGGAPLGYHYGYSWHELYLMGLAAASEVSPWFYIGGLSPPQPNNYFPTSGVTVRGTRIPVLVDQIIAAEGKRTPDFQSTKKSFSVPFVLLHAKGEVVSTDQLARLQNMRDQWKVQWERAVGNRATLVTKFSTIAAIPSFTASSVVNAASFAPGVVPGGLISLFGIRLTSGVSGVVSAGAVPLPTEIRGTAVTFSGWAAAIVAVANLNGQEQINLQVPWEVAGLDHTTVIVRNNGLSSQGVQVGVLTAQPGIFAIADGATGERLGPDRPSSRSDVVVIYATGLGEVLPRPLSGAPAGLSRTTGQVFVTVGGVNAPVRFSGLAPGFVGLYQVNAEIPISVQTGGADVVVSINGHNSNSVRISIR